MSYLVSNFYVRLVDNDSVGWVVDWLEGNWYHCAACREAEESTLRTRLGYGARFCSHCGSELDWNHLDPNDDDLAVLQAQIERDTGKKVSVRWG